MMNYSFMSLIPLTHCQEAQFAIELVKEKKQSSKRKNLMFDKDSTISDNFSGFVLIGSQVNWLLK